MLLVTKCCCASIDHDIVREYGVCPVCLNQFITITIDDAVEQESSENSES